ADLLPGWTEQDRSHHETQRDQAEQRYALFDQTEGAFPQQEPGGECNRDRPPLIADAGGELQGKTDATNLRREHEKVDDRYRNKRYDEEVEAESLANSVWNCVMADGGKSARHLNQ